MPICGSPHCTIQDPISGLVSRCEAALDGSPVNSELHIQKYCVTYTVSNPTATGKCLLNYHISKIFGRIYLQKLSRIGKIKLTIIPSSSESSH